MKNVRCKIFITLGIGGNTEQNHIAFIIKIIDQQGEIMIS